ncbi:MAG: cyclic nucleotide-binding domain-containing protein [Magnetospirillum sp. WYHS-4]
MPKGSDVSRSRSAKPRPAKPDAGPLLRKVCVTAGVYWVECVPADLYVLCGCPADSVKHLMRRGLIVPMERHGVQFESGPNAILLSDDLLQNGSFCNLSEFPVLQMLYRQGMILPGHPNNRGHKPLIVGSRIQVDSQIRYIHRGNYGLCSEEEIREAGVPVDEAREMMRIKLRFAFGAIRDSSELVELLYLDDGPVEVRGGVMLERLSKNRFRFAYGDEEIEVDLNLPPFQTYQSAYPLGFHNIQREYFSILHNGDGDGWDPDRPCMASILLFQGKVYLIDAGPNVSNTLNSLGIGINEVEGIFHTHCHDDHFAGLTELFRSDHRIKYYATPLVRHSVGKKLSALLGVHEDLMAEFFDIRDLEFDIWNVIAGLEVKPLPSPHPVETNIFLFRAHWGGGYRTYAHYADIAALDVLEGMVTEDPAKPGIGRARLEQVRDRYLTPANVKKLDIGGGLIHGCAQDFACDASRKIILAHVGRPLTDAERAIGSGSPFGTVDMLIPSNQDYVWRYTHQFLTSYFPNLPGHELRMLMNNPLVTFNPQTILLREGEIPDYVYLVVTGNVEVINQVSDVHGVLSAGVLVGEMAGLHALPSTETHRAMSFVRALQVPIDLYLEFVRRNDLFGDISRLMEYREFLQDTWLCREIVTAGTLNAIAQSITRVRYPAGAAIDHDSEDNSGIGFVKTGSVRRYGHRKGRAHDLETLGPGDFFGEETAVFWTTYGYDLKTATPTEVYYADARILATVPRVRWKLYETYQRRKEMGG